MTTPTPDATELARKVEALESQLNALQDQLAPATPSPLLAGAGPATTPTTAPADRGERPDPVTDRRTMLRRAGTVAAAAAAGGAALAMSQSSPAAANNGNSVIIGSNGASSNTGSATTELRSSANTGTMGLFVVQDGSTTITLYPAAVQGIANGTAVDNGVYGATSATGGTGVVASATGTGGIGLFASGDLVDLRLGGLGAEPSQASPNRGGFAFTAADNLWFSPTNTAGTWTHLAGPSVAGMLHVLSNTTRIYDSRPGTQPPTGVKSKYQDGDVRALDATGNGSGVPSAARAVMISATATNTNSGGFFSFYKTGIAFPGNSNLNWGLVNSTVAVTTVVACGTGATFNSRMQGAGGSDLVIDVIGYYL